MQTYPIPVRFTAEEKYILEKEAKEYKLALSTHIKSIVHKAIQSKLKTVNKSTILIEKIRALNLDPEIVERAAEEGRKMRREFKLTRD